MPRSSPRVRRDASPRPLPRKQTAAPPAARPNPRRPIYYSDADTRPTYRGTSYRLIRSSGVASSVLVCYLGFVARTAAIAGGALPDRLFALITRAFHAGILHWNVVLSDDLHNLDLDLGDAYTLRKSAPAVAARERTLHALDWRVAITLPFSYNLLHLSVCRGVHRIDGADVALFVPHALLYAAMNGLISAERITPKRELFGWYAGTFVAQLALLLVVFMREFERRPLWMGVWPIYAAGLVLKGVEWPSSEHFGHHEMMHAAIILGNLAGLVVDVYYATN